MDLNDLQQAWVEFLSSRPWQCFYTQTFRDPVPYPRLAMDRLAYILRQSAAFYGIRIFAFVAAESHKLGSYHSHSIFLSEPVPFLRLWDSLRWTWQLGFSRYGLCRIEDIRRIGGVAGYVAKYILKRPADYDFYWLP